MFTKSVPPVPGVPPSLAGVHAGNSIAGGSIGNEFAHLSPQPTASTAEPRPSRYKSSPMQRRLLEQMNSSSNTGDRSSTLVNQRKRAEVANIEVPEVQETNNLSITVSAGDLAQFISNMNRLLCLFARLPEDVVKDLVESQLQNMPKVLQIAKQQNKREAVLLELPAAAAAAAKAANREFDHPEPAGSLRDSYEPNIASFLI